MSTTQVAQRSESNLRRAYIYRLPAPTRSLVIMRDKEKTLSKNWSLPIFTICIAMPQTASLVSPHSSFLAHYSIISSWQWRNIAALGSLNRYNMKLDILSLLSTGSPLRGCSSHYLRPTMSQTLASNTLENTSYC